MKSKPTTSASPGQGHEDDERQIRYPPTRTASPSKARNVASAPKRDALRSTTPWPPTPPRAHASQSVRRRRQTVRSPPIRGYAMFGAGLSRSARFHGARRTVITRTLKMAACARAPYVNRSRPKSLYWDRKPTSNLTAATSQGRPNRRAWGGPVTRPRRSVLLNPPHPGGPWHPRASAQDRTRYGPCKHPPSQSE
jgi:hypothetical protein